MGKHFEGSLGPRAQQVNVCGRLEASEEDLPVMSIRSCFWTLPPFCLHPHPCLPLGLSCFTCAPRPGPGHLPTCCRGAGVMKVCCRLNLCPPQILMLKLSSQGNGVRRWGPQEVIRWGPHGPEQYPRVPWAHLPREGAASRHRL